MSHTSFEHEFEINDTVWIGVDVNEVCCRNYVPREVKIHEMWFHKGSRLYRKKPEGEKGYDQIGTRNIVSYVYDDFKGGSKSEEEVFSNEKEAQLWCDKANEKAKERHEKLKLNRR